MSKIFKLGLLALLVYLMIQEGPALVEKISELGAGLGRKGAAINQSECVTAAERASETLAKGLRKFSEPPIDVKEWDRFTERVREKIYEAQDRCDCPRPSCDRANEAVEEVNNLMVDFTNNLRGDSIALNPANRQETIDRMLKRAREYDRQGD